MVIKHKSDICISLCCIFMYTIRAAPVNIHFFGFLLWIVERIDVAEEAT